MESPLSFCRNGGVEHDRICIFYFGNQESFDSDIRMVKIRIPYYS